MIPLIETLETNLWLRFLIDATMKSFVIFAVAGLFGFILRHRSAAVRGLVWSLAMLGCLIVPLFSITLPQWEVGVLPATPERFSMDRLADNRQAAIFPVPIGSRPLPSTIAPSTQITPPLIQSKSVSSESGVPQSNMSETGLTSLHWTDWLAVCWAGGMLFFLARLIVGIGAVWHISIRSNAFSISIPQVQPGWKQPVRVRQSDAVTVPMVWGWFRPVILLPADADEWEPERRRAVLLHELAHIQRQDWLMQTIAHITCAVYWFNPLLWFAVRRMQAEAERACDDHVLNAGHHSTDYAQYLLDIVRTIKATSIAKRSAVAMARSSKIEGRLRMVLAENRNRRPLTKIAVAVGLLALTCFAVPMGVMQLAEAVGPEQALYQEIQDAANFQPEPLPETATEAEIEVLYEQYQQNRKHGLQLCEQFLNTYLESERYDEVLYMKLIYVRNLKSVDEFEVSVEAFLLEHPTSKYANKARKLRAYHLESQFKFDEAIAEWDKIDDPALLLEAYQRKATIYAHMGNSVKAEEFNLLSTELILGKPAPEFSHTSVYGIPVSLKDLRGKVVVLYHWSTRDGQTMRADETGGEILRLKQLHKTYGENPNFVLITICLQSSEAKLKQLIETHAIPGIHLLLEPEEVPYQFGVISWPHYVVLDKAGILRESGHSFALEDLVTALLTEDIDVPGERIIPRISKLRAAGYSGPDQEEKAIAEYEKLLAFMPNTPHIMAEVRRRKFHLAMAEFHRKRAQTGEAMRFMNQAYERIVEESQLSIELKLDLSLDLAIGDHAAKLAQFFSQQGDQEKTWTLFQIAVTHYGEGNSIINYARQQPARFAAIQDMPEFQKLIAETPLTPLTESQRHSREADRKREMYAEDFYAAYKSFVTVKADDEIFTGVILSQVGHILVPASVAEAETIRVKIVDYQSAKVVAIDWESGLAIVQVNGQTDLRPIVLGNVEDLREYAPIPILSLIDGSTIGYTHPSMSVISTRGYPNAPNLPPEFHQNAFETPTDRGGSIQELEIDDSGKVAALQAGTPTGKIIRGDAFVYHDGRLLAVAVDSEVRYEFGSAITNPVLIDQIRAALERINIINLIKSQINKPTK